MNAAIVELREGVSKPRAKPAKLPAPAAARAEKRAVAKASNQEVKAQRVSAALLGSVAAVLTALSLSDLASGVELITHASTWQSYALAVGIDCSMLATEAAALAASDKVRRETRWAAWSMLVGTLGLSGVLNAFEFGSFAETLPFQIAGATFGLAIPAAIFLLLKQAASHYLDSHRRS